MGIPKFLLLNQLISKPTLESFRTLSQPPQKPHFNLFIQIRTYATPNTAANNNKIKSKLYSEIVLSVVNSPKTSVLPLLDKYVNQLNDELRRIIHTLRKKNRFDRALEVSEWMTDKSLKHPISADLAVQLDLIGQVHGLDAAERFFSEVDEHSEKMYGTLLNLYVKTNLVDKSLSHFKKMKDMGLVTSPLPYNNIMSMYMNIGQGEKIPEMLLEMEDTGVSPDIVSYRICLKSYAVRSDFTSMEKLLKIIETLPRISVEWITYATVANYYLEGDQKEKAIYYLQKAENIIRNGPAGYNNLITMYAKLGDVTQVMRLWRKHKAACKAQINNDYMNVVRSLVKLNEFEQAETLLREWESSGNFYDFRIPNILLVGYTQKGMVEKAERMLQGIIAKGRTPIPETWTIISSGHVKCGNMYKALLSMKNALELGPHHQGWFPNLKVTSSILKWLGENGDIEEVDEFVKLLSRVVPADSKMYQTLVKANIRHGNEINDILPSMKADNIDVDQEMDRK